TLKDGQLDTVIETDNLQKTEFGVSSDQEIELNGNEPVSMNFWGFTPVLFDDLRKMFVDFLSTRGKELKSEFLIPTVINDLIQSGREKVRVLYSNDPWFGVTYKEDKSYVQGEIQKLVEKGVYPQNLFGK
ncbi:MAG: nucleotidyltransferase, partial [Candidatus Marinimicrobia bacterium]|nr:nucleotidyltransferase [Candidatus Neomarinimicrobiota bacterium]